MTVFDLYVCSNQISNDTPFHVLTADPVELKFENFHRIPYAIKDSHIYTFDIYTDRVEVCVRYRAKGGEIK